MPSHRHDISVRENESSLWIDKKSVIEQVHTNFAIGLQAIAKLLLEAKIDADKAVEMFRQSFFQEMRRKAASGGYSQDSIATEHNSNVRQIQRHSVPETGLYRTMVKRNLLRLFEEHGGELTSGEAASEMSDRRWEYSYIDERWDFTAHELICELVQEGCLTEKVRGGKVGSLYKRNSSHQDWGVTTIQDAVLLASESLLIAVRAALAEIEELHSEDYRQKFAKFRQSVEVGEDLDQNWPRPQSSRILYLNATLKSEADIGYINDELHKALKNRLLELVDPATVGDRVYQLALAFHLPQSTSKENSQ